MKKYGLVLLTFVPIIAGYILNLTILVPGIGTLLYYLLPLLTTVFWLWTGMQFARSSWKNVPALLIGNATAVGSLLLFLCLQFFAAEGTRFLPLMVFSQMFGTSAPNFLLARLALLFESEPNTIGTASFVALKVISVVFMIAVFCAGFFCEKMRARKSANR